MDEVLLVTGGFVSVKDTSLWTVLHKQLASYRRSSGAGYDLHIKAVNAELMLAVRGYEKSGRAGLRLRNAVYRAWALPPGVGARGAGCGARSSGTSRGVNQSPWRPWRPWRRKPGTP